MHRPRRSLSILIYHRVLPHPDPLLPDVVDARRFDRQMALLKRRFNVLPLGTAVRALRHGTLPPRAACITFDDGYADNAAVALPILRRHGLSACFFIASAYLDGGRMWNDDVIESVRQAQGPVLDLCGLDGLRQLTIATAQDKAAAIAAILSALKYLPAAQRQALAARMAPAATPQLMMRSDQLIALHRAGMEIGAHTASHPILSNLPDAAARADIVAGRAALEALIDAPVRLFAYPNGQPGRDYDGRHAAMVAALGFDAAVSTAPGAARAGADPYQLPRFTPWDRSPLRFWLRLQHNIWRTPVLTAP